ncbi:MORC family CW-type zinc finger protein 3 isoform X2 [Lingula anatina]|uniref:MORC family CW-type zinc finger protein 3 isoform X2 n=1 Tax=Lingula anatina TaxID=7574 RepID=A0A1S3IQN8_LINAN|nr:MORC family CW-type zinc finger protein 3 isoform X2 [Lingula anatina]|eukprot:XP_013400383.1 MORC family CW-type zinc finger protein 3 isoform X2 [Lingula anatina]
MEKGVRLSKTSPSFLHANSTSHTWIFSAIAELIDNAYDPDCNASQLRIDKRIIGQKDCLIFIDNGNGMNPDKLHKMLSFGFCEKVEIKGHKPVGHYGNGFKSGSMRLGRDAIVFTKQEDTISVGFLSQTFLEMTNAETVLTPIVTWDSKSRQILHAPDTQGSIDAITMHSFFHSEKELLDEFQAISGQTGTEIIIFNLKTSSDGMLELDFQSKPDDIMNLEHEQMDLNTTANAVNRPVVEHKPEYTRSLREYCSILFLKPRMKIILRGSKVKTKLITKSLSETESDVYRPTWLKKTMKIIFGFSPQKQDYGIMLYHRNRLIKAYEKVGCQKQNNPLGVGVVGVAEVDFLEPIHNKQDFNKTARYNACISALGRKLDDYWNEKMSADGNNTTVNRSQKPDWTWVQCDNPQCLKWRRLPDGVDDSNLPDKWYCYLNPDPTHNRCDIEEEPEDENDVSRASYPKTYKKQQKLKKHSYQPPQHVQQASSSQDNKPKPVIKELERANRQLMEAKRREEEQGEVFMKLMRQNKKVEKKQKKLMQEARRVKLLTSQSEALLASTSDQPSVSSRNESSDKKKTYGVNITSKAPARPPSKRKRHEGEHSDAIIMTSDDGDNLPVSKIPKIEREPQDVKPCNQTGVTTTYAGSNGAQNPTELGSGYLEEIDNLKRDLYNLRRNVAELLNFLSPDVKIDSDNLHQVDAIVDDLNKQNRMGQVEEV